MPITIPGRVTRVRNLPDTSGEPSEVPVTIKSRGKLPTVTSTMIRRKIAQHLGYAAPLVTRAVVRFEDVNGPRGGSDVRCHVEVHLAGRPPLVVEQRGGNPEAAFATAIPRVAERLSRIRGRAGLRSGRTKSTKAASDSQERRAAPRAAGEPGGRSPTTKTRSSSARSAAAAKATAPAARARRGR